MTRKEIPRIARTISIRRYPPARLGSPAGGNLASNGLGGHRRGHPQRGGMLGTPALAEPPVGAGVARPNEGMLGGMRAKSRWRGGGAAILTVVACAALARADGPVVHEYVPDVEENEG